MKSHFFKRHSFGISLALIAALNFLFLACLSASRSLWHDDIYQLFFSWDRTFMDSMKTILEVDLNPPLWGILSFLWLKIAPFGTFWLRLPSLLFVSTSSCFLGLAAKELYGKRVGVITAILCALSPYVAIECAFSFRAYGLYLFVSSLTAFAYVRKLKRPSLGNRIFFFLGVLSVSMTHYFGALLCAFLFLSDLILACKRRQPKTFFLEYGIACLLELPWVVLHLETISSAMLDFWPPTPSFLSYLHFFKAMPLNSYVLAPLLLILTVWFWIRSVRRYRRENADSLWEPEHYTRVLFLAIPLILVLSILVYCNIAPRSSAWVYRYFFSIFPFLILFYGFALSDFIDWLSQKIASPRWTPNLLALLLSVLILIPNYTIQVIVEEQTEYEPFEQVADMLMEQPEIVNREDAIIYCTINCVDGWRYYLSENRSRSMEGITLLGNADYFRDPQGIMDSMKNCELVFFYEEHLQTESEEILAHQLRAELSKTHDEIIMDADRDVYKFVRRS